MKNSPAYPWCFHLLTTRSKSWLFKVSPIAALHTLRSPQFVKAFSPVAPPAFSYKAATADSISCAAEGRNFSKSTSILCSRICKDSRTLAEKR